MNFYIFAVLLVVGVGYASAQKNKDYCSICSNHTMCVYKGIGPACKEGGQGGVTAEEKQEIVDVHNMYRRLVATGQESRGRNGPQPKGANILKMRWDNELAQVAQRWADQCTFEHDACRHVDRFKVGQNIYWKWSMPVTAETNWTAAVESWYEEVTLFNPENIPRFKFHSKTGHYTQVLWHDTYLVGCGRRNYGPNKIYVCNYGPAGNWLKRPMYALGEPCTQCPEGTTCSDYLCDGTPIAPSKPTPSKYPVKPSYGKNPSGYPMKPVNPKLPETPFPNKKDPFQDNDMNESVVKEYVTPEGKRVRVTVITHKDNGFFPVAKPSRTYTFSGSYDEIMKKIKGIQDGSFDVNQFLSNA